MKNTTSHNHMNLKSYFDCHPEDQGNEGRHKCAGCAYIIGYYIGYNNKHYDLDFVISMIPDSQAQPQRHHILRDQQMMDSIRGEQTKRMGSQQAFLSKKLRNSLIQTTM